MGVDARAIIAGELDFVRVAAMVEAATSGTVRVERGTADHAFMVVMAPGLARPRTLSVMHNGYDNLDVLPGMRTFVGIGGDPEGVALLRSVLAFTGGHLNPNDADDEWEHVPASTSDGIALTPDQELAVALNGMADGRVAGVLVAFCSDPDSRAALEAALATRREAEPDARPGP